MRVRRHLPGVERSAGCTEPGAIALAAAAAAALLEGPIEEVEVRCDPSTYKNAVGAGLPGPAAGRAGAALAAALGAAARAPVAAIELLARASGSHLAEAEALLARGAVRVEARPASGPPRIRIEARVRSAGSTARAVLDGAHTRLTQLEVDGAPRPLPPPRETDAGAAPPIAETSLAELFALAATCDADDAEFLRAGLELNLAAARAELGAGWRAPEDAALEAELLAMAASRARMSGVGPAVTTSGFSGNQGIVATIPVGVVARRTGASEAALAAALATSHLVGRRVRAATGLLSPLCNALHAASVGAAAGCARLLGGDAEAAGRSGDLVLASVAGALCDGAKPGCAFKVGLAAQRSVRCAELALAGVAATARDGVVGRTPEETIAHLGRLAHPALAPADEELLRIVADKA